MIRTLTDLLSTTSAADRAAVLFVSVAGRIYHVESTSYEDAGMDGERSLRFILNTAAESMPDPSA